MERNFKGIWIPKEIWLNKKLTVMEKLFLVEIDSLDNEKGCYASNKHFSEFFSLSKNRCTEIIKSLESKGFLSIEIIRKESQIIKRIIKIKGVRKTEQPYSENLDNPIRKTEQPYSENLEENNTLLNNTKREIRALDFFKINSPGDYEAYLMQNKKLLKDFEKFSEDFNDKVDIEGLEFTTKIIKARLNTFTRNWIVNQNKFNVKSNDAVVLHPALKRIG